MKPPGMLPLTMPADVQGCHVVLQSLLHGAQDLSDQHMLCLYAHPLLELARGWGANDRSPVEFGDLATDNHF